MRSQNNNPMNIIDTHAHLDGEEYKDDLPAVIERARTAGVSRILIPAINLLSIGQIQKVCADYPDIALLMIGLHPEEVRPNYEAVLRGMKLMLQDNLSGVEPGARYIAIGEVGLDFYWSREYENEQLAAFEEQVRWSVETQLPLAIHCRRAQNEMVRILRRYEDELPGGVFHCFSGNEMEAQQLLAFSKFALGIGGVLTFRKSRLHEVLAHAVPLNRIVLETDCPYMAPAPHRGKRNESAFITSVVRRLSLCYNVPEAEIAAYTANNARRIFGEI